MGVANRHDGNWLANGTIPRKEVWPAHGGTSIRMGPVPSARLA
jgi:hypothetical protein